MIFLLEKILHGIVLVIEWILTVFVCGIAGSMETNQSILCSDSDSDASGESCTETLSEDFWKHKT